MKIQSLSVVVPNQHCVNNCAFCVSKMHCDTYKNQMDDNLPFFDLYLRDYIKRLEFARDNGCNTVMLTGTSEPQQNRKFLTYFGMIMQMMQHPFRCIEMQTTGVMLDENYLRFLRNHVGVNLISLSISSLDNSDNAWVIDMPRNLNVNIAKLCQQIKTYDFNLRLSLNLTNLFEPFCADPKTLFQYCKGLSADQVTLRVLYSSGTGTKQDQWIEHNALSQSNVLALQNYVRENGYVLGVLPHGATKYSVNGLCVVIDSDCMDKAEKNDEDYKYLVLQPNCKLYSTWDDPASLIF
jgi:hypothetical protein